MISFLYRRHAHLLLAFVALSFPYFYIQANSIRSNNDIETWLPRDTDVRQTYENFKRDFGAEEAIIIGLPQELAAPGLMEAVAGRLELIPGVRSCWTAARVQGHMDGMGVDTTDARQRLEGLLISPEGDYQGVIALLDREGIANRAAVVTAFRKVLDYCQLTNEQVVMTGPPVIVTELDRLGSQDSSRKYFAITCLISLSLLYLSFGHWGMSLSTLGVTLWGIYVTQTVLAWCGGEMNFIMGSLSVMVMIFTLSIAVHFVSYYSSARQAQHPDPMAQALRECWAPCWLSTLTTLLGLLSLNVSNILPVAQFGYAAALGAILALVVGLGVMPALVVVWPDCTTRSMGFRMDFGNWADRINQSRRTILQVAAGTAVLVVFGLMQLKSDIDPVEFLPRRSPILTNLKTIESRLTNVDSIEAIVEFTDREQPFFERLQAVRAVHNQIAAHPGVRHVMSAASFFPTEMPESSFEVAGILSRARSMGSDSGWVADRERQWRISARVRRSAEFSPIDILTDLDRDLAGTPIRFTGLTPLLKSAQQEIFDGFWQSFTMACLTITVVMILSLRSVVAGLIAMIPNMAPIALVFGGVGFLGMPVDIGMMMTGSIALGISVDCTFHFLVHYRSAYNEGCTSAEACRRALLHSGEPMLESTMICSLGMLALCLSSFVPTARFGALMAGQMLASLLGELVLLPALLCCRPSPRAVTVEETATSPVDAVPAPKFLRHRPALGLPAIDSLENVA
ncbi:MMPL family transporter [bacterium]|nr:MMPL family transporter [bacterium]